MKISLFSLLSLIPTTFAECELSPSGNSCKELNPQSPGACKSKCKVWTVQNFFTKLERNICECVVEDLGVEDEGLIYYEGERDVESDTVGVYDDSEDGEEGSEEEVEYSGRKS